MKLKEKVAARLKELGFECFEEDFKIVVGPKVMSDILECWRVNAIRMADSKKVEIVSDFTMTELEKMVYFVIPNPPNSVLYGDYIVSTVPSPA